MNGPDFQLRRDRVDREARALGYVIHVDKAPNHPRELAYMAFATRDVGGPVMGAFLTYGPSEIEAAEAGLETLGAIVERGEPWPARPGL
jgi:hypothetical protein